MTVTESNNGTASAENPPSEEWPDGVYADGDGELWVRPGNPLPVTWRYFSPSRNGWCTPTGTVPVSNTQSVRCRPAFVVTDLVDVPTFAERERVRGLEEQIANQRRTMEAQVDLITQLRDRARETQAAHDAWKASATETLHREANNRNYCSEFDDVMEAIGLPRRRTTWGVNVSVVINRVIQVEASTEDEAVEQINDDLVATHLNDLILSRWDVDVDTDGAEPAS